LPVAFFALLVTGCTEPGQAASEPDAPSLTPSQEHRFTVGQVEGGHWDSFSRVVSVDFDSEGRLVILDAGGHQVVVVAPDGSPVVRFGSRGDGPGQFRMPQALTLLPSGEIAVSDAGHRSLLVFDQDGEYRRALPLPEGTMGGANPLFPYLDDGVVFASRGFVVSAAGGRASMPTDVPIYRMGMENGEEARVLHRAWTPPRDMGEARTVRGSQGAMRVPGIAVRAFEPQLHLAVLPDGRIAVADSSAYRIRILSPDGEEDGWIERPIEPRAVTERHREAERERRLQEFAEGGGPQIQIRSGGQILDQGDLREMLEERIRAMEFWPELPVIRAMNADGEGRIWVQRSAEPTERGPIDVLTPDGRILGSIPPELMEFPDAFGPDGLVAWIELDELEVPRVRVARLEDLP
jgi:hypothetical protein